MKPKENDLSETHISAALGLHHPAELLNEAEIWARGDKKRCFDFSRRLLSSKKRVLFLEKASLD